MEHIHLYSFEKLTVWQKSKAVVLKVYELTNGMPNSERFGLCSQMQRAAVSVSSNIAEGNARKGGKDQARFTRIAYSSLIELLNQLIISHELKMISASSYTDCRLMIQELTRMLVSLESYQRKSQ